MVFSRGGVGRGLGVAWGLVLGFVLTLGLGVYFGLTGFGLGLLGALTTGKSAGSLSISNGLTESCGSKVAVVSGSGVESMLASKSKSNAGIGA